LPGAGEGPMAHWPRLPRCCTAAPPPAAKGVGEGPASGREGSRGRSSPHCNLVPATSTHRTSMDAG
jgi:hypothetical protein